MAVMKMIQGPNTQCISLMFAKSQISLQVPYLKIVTVFAQQSPVTMHWYIIHHKSDQGFLYKGIIFPTLSISPRSTNIRSLKISQKLSLFLLNLHFKSFPSTEMEHVLVVQISPLGRWRPVYPAQSIPWLLMVWWCRAIQQPWYWAICPIRDQDSRSFCFICPTNDRVYVCGYMPWEHDTQVRNADCSITYR